MLMRQAGAALISLTVVFAGLNKQAQLKGEVQLLKGYELALEQLRECVCYEKLTLPAALCSASVGKDSAVISLFQKASEAITSQESTAGEPILLGHALPIRSLCATGQAQERILRKLTEEVRNDRLQREGRLDERCRSCMSISVALSAICAIVLL